MTPTIKKEIFVMMAVCAVLGTIVWYFSLRKQSVPTTVPGDYYASGSSVASKLSLHPDGSYESFCGTKSNAKGKWRIDAPSVSPRSIYFYNFRHCDGSQWGVVQANYSSGRITISEDSGDVFFKNEK